jgi:DTW domain-containing protein YfiP
MNENTPILSPDPGLVTDDEIRDYAYHLYVQNGHRNDKCGENWLEAKACLGSRIPKAQSSTRLHEAAARKDAAQNISA